MIKLETAHFAKGNTPNGLAVYLRSIRAIYNRAIKAGIVSEQYYPFKKYTIKTVTNREKGFGYRTYKSDHFVAIRERACPVPCQELLCRKLYDVWNELY